MHTMRSRLGASKYDAFFAKMLMLHVVYATRPITTPAAIVSPPLLINTLPISLLSLAVSSGIVADRLDPGGERSVISTSAVVPFCKTLNGKHQHKYATLFSTTQGSKEIPSTHRGFFLTTCPFSEILNSFEMLAGTFIEWWNSSTWIDTSANRLAPSLKVPLAT